MNTTHRHDRGASPSRSTHVEYVSHKRLPHTPSSSRHRGGSARPRQSEHTGAKTSYTESRPAHTHGSTRGRAYSAAPRSTHDRGSGRSSFSSSSRSGGTRTSKGRVLKTFDVSRYMNTNPVTPEADEVFTPKHKFSEFGLDKKLAFTVTSSGLTSPTHIQDEIIPHIMEGRDVIGLSNTGTGKTAAFLIPLIDKTLREYSRQTLILTPTRELAIQIEAELKKLSNGFKIFATTCVGGTSIRPQIQGLRRKNHFVIGTPGRIIDLIDRGVFRPQTVTTVVLDEADRMLDMGFINDMRSILKGIDPNRETLFFSATMSDDIKRLVNDFLKNPVTVSVKKRDITNSVHQDVVRFSHSDKFETLTKLLEDTELKRVLIFGAMKHSVEKLANALIEHGVSADSIHGNKSHPQRQRALTRFKSGHARVLVATDVAARGIHVDNVTHVINYDLPATYEDYVHRIGRTGRGTQSGKALTFVER